MRMRYYHSFMMAGVLALFCAVALTGYYLWEDYQAEVQAQILLAQVQQEHVAEADLLPMAETPPILENELLLPRESVLGVLQIGERKLPIMDRYDEQWLRTYPCRYGEDRCGAEQLIIAGHNYESHFRLLQNIEEGAEAAFTDADGNTRQYRLTERIEISGYDVDALFAGEWDLSLFTCAVNRSNRVVARFALIEPNSPDAYEAEIIEERGGNDYV